MRSILNRVTCAAALYCAFAAGAVAEAALASRAAPAAAAAPAAQVDSGWVPMVLASGAIPSFRARVNGVETLAALDTGASTLVLDRRFAATAGVQASGTGSAVATGGAVSASTASGISVGVGQAVLSGLRGEIVDLGPANAAKRTQFGAIVGTSAFGKGALEIDFRNMRFRITRAAEAPKGAVAVPMSLSQGVPVVAVTLAGAPGTRVMIDTGKDTDLSVTPRQLQALRRPGVAETTLARAGIGGISVATLATVPQLNLQGFSVGEVGVELDPDDTLIRRVGADAIAGTRLLRRFNIVLDFAGGRAFLSPSGAALEALPKSTSGLQLAYGPAAAEVVHVMKGSPAEAAGWKPHDRVCTIDGTPVAAVRESPALKGWGTDRPGRTVRLGMCDGQTRILTLARFY